MTKKARGDCFKQPKRSTWFACRPHDARSDMWDAACRLGALLVDNTLAWIIAFFGIAMSVASCECIGAAAIVTSADASAPAGGALAAAAVASFFSFFFAMAADRGGLTLACGDARRFTDRDGGGLLDTLVARNDGCGGGERRRARAERETVAAGAAIGGAAGAREAAAIPRPTTFGRPTTGRPEPRPLTNERPPLPK
jgi:hypothetical protein